eukprot:762616-Hanusia_phi.AAC.6
MARMVQVCVDESIIRQKSDYNPIIGPSPSFRAFLKDLRSDYKDVEDFIAKLKADFNLPTNVRIVNFIPSFCLTVFRTLPRP